MHAESTVTFPPEDEVFYPPHLTPEDAEIVDKLHAIFVSLDFQDAPLFGVIDYLREITGLNLIVDSRLGDPARNVTIQCRDVSVRHSLRLLLASSGLAHAVEGGVVVIAARERLQSRVYLELYDVQDLVNCPFGEDALVRLVVDGSHHDWSEDRGESLQYQNGLLIVRTSRDVHARLTPLLESVRVNPEAWRRP